MVLALQSKLFLDHDDSDTEREKTPKKPRLSDATLDNVNALKERWPKGACALHPHSRCIKLAQGHFDLDKNSRMQIWAYSIVSGVSKFEGIPGLLKCLNIVRTPTPEVYLSLLRPTTLYLTLQWPCQKALIPHP
jgi:hypothetical protein